jgi:anaerobic selenocysteine-containing dehydrogenase
VLLNRPAIAPLGRPSPTARSSASWHGTWASQDDCFSERRRKLCRIAYGDAVDFEQLLDKGFASLRGAGGAVRRRRFPRPSGKCEFFSQRLAAQGPGRPARPLPNYEGAGSSAQFPLAMISPPARNFLNSTFVNVQEPARHRGRTAAGNAPADAQARGLRSRQTSCVSSTSAAITAASMEVSQPRPPGRRQRPGHLVAQAGAGRAPTSTSSPASG